MRDLYEAKHWRGGDSKENTCALGGRAENVKKNEEKANNEHLSPKRGGK